MSQKLITFAVPCYNSADYMRHCVQTLLAAGEDAEIILVDDGSTKDDTPAICDEFAAQYPTIVKAIHLFSTLQAVSCTSSTTYHALLILIFGTANMQMCPHFIMSSQCGNIRQHGLWPALHSAFAVSG